MPVSIYVHIPFCRRKCNYCAFYSKVSGEEEKKIYVNALTKEIETGADGEICRTIYFGGGTPSTLTLNQISKIFSTIAKNFKVEKNAEITIEVNPGTVDEIYLKSLRETGFNRISVGIQSFDDKFLKIAGRIHDSKTGIETVRLAKKFFDNVNFDLIQGLPGQKLSDVERDLKFVAELNPEHISLYDLEIDEGTKFFELERAGKLKNLPDEKSCAEMYDLICDTLPSFGYRHYEISNFSKPGFESRHNSGYWTGEKYFGFGAAAHSYNGNFRTSNISSVAGYAEKIFAGESVSEIEEVVTKKNAIEEFCFLGLRMTEGISKKIFAEKFDEDIFKIYGEVIEKNLKFGLLEISGDKIRFTRRGMKLGNSVFADFLL